MVGFAAPFGPCFFDPSGSVGLVIRGGEKFDAWGAYRESGTKSLFYLKGKKDGDGRGKDVARALVNETKPAVGIQQCQATAE